MRENRLDQIWNITAELMALGCLGIAIITPFKIYKKGFLNPQYRREYKKQVRPLCQKVMRRFDKDKDGMLQEGEGVDMARTIGYDRILPSGNLLFDLQSGDYEDKTVELCISSHGSHVGGFSPGSPAWHDVYEFPVSKLEKLASTPR